MFCMARIVCHLNFEAIATQSTLRVSGSHTCQEFVEDNNIKNAPHFSGVFVRQLNRQKA